MSVLPEKLSDLIDLALTDLAVVEGKPDEFEVNMGVWLMPPQAQDDDICTVCLAGAVLINTFNITYEGLRAEVGPELVKDRDDQNRLYALDQLRRGEVYNAADRLGLNFCSKFREFDRTICSYSWGPAKFREDMKQLANDLRAEGY